MFVNAKYFVFINAKRINKNSIYEIHISGVYKYYFLGMSLSHASDCEYGEFQYDEEETDSISQLWMQDFDPAKWSTPAHQART